MKKKSNKMESYIKLIIVAIIMTGFISCDDRFEEVNTIQMGLLMLIRHIYLLKEPGIVLGMVLLEHMTIE